MNISSRLSTAVHLAENRKYYYWLAVLFSIFLRMFITRKSTKVVKVGCSQAFNSLAFHFICIYVVDKSVHIINNLSACFKAFLFVDEIVNSLLAFVFACFRGFQIITKFA